MARGKKTDSETRANIMSKKIENPDLSTRDIAKDVWISHNAVNEILKEIPEVITSNDKTIELVNVNLEIIKKGKKLIEKSIGTLPMEKYSDLSQLSKVIEDAFKQNQLLTGQATENVNVLDMSEEQKQVIAQRWINKN